MFMQSLRSCCRAAAPGAFLLALMVAVPIWAQTETPTRISRPASPFAFPWRLNSPQVHSDDRVTFCFLDPNAHEVLLQIEGAAKPTPMEKDSKGVWSVTIGPLGPDFYAYSFLADGVGLIDPSNPLLKPNLL
jgi:hypothetical protein